MRPSRRFSPIFAAQPKLVVDSLWRADMNGTGPNNQFRPANPVHNVRALVDAAADDQKPNPRHRIGTDRPDGRYVGSVDGDDEKNCSSARRTDNQIR